ncbi:hypothetical protein QJS10_CPA06g00611 [Acorus calamus]|uniref:Uncharacterized protein n=1 Tax=Acorus calamus TaxID=4465 RepID=A0AAV9ES47_ACOCL|nr:hypothetical protein QJS10_CPA06g00611 [Acorus calamus]
MFRAWVEDNHLQLLEQKGSTFTWCNNCVGMERTWEVFDQAFATPEWLTQYPMAITQVLPRHSSDHAPILLATEPPHLGVVSHFNSRGCGLSILISHSS